LAFASKRKNELSQLKIVVSWGKNELSSERSSYFMERTTYPEKGWRILEKEQPIQQKVDVSWRKNNLSSKRMLYSGERTTYPEKG